MSDSRSTVDDVFARRVRWAMICAESEAWLKTQPTWSFGGGVLDPPYALGTRDPTPQEVLAYMQGSALDTGGDFMGAKWSLPPVSLWRELLRVFKPGAYLAVFASTSTDDLIGIGLRMAGWERRGAFELIGTGRISWVQASGMAKGSDIGKAVDEAAGVEREVVGLSPHDVKRSKGDFGFINDNGWEGGKPRTVTAPSTPDGQRLDGYRTDVSPKHEIVLLFQRPIDAEQMVATIDSCLSTLDALLAARSSRHPHAKSDPTARGTVPGPVVTPPEAAKVPRTVAGRAAGASPAEATFTSRLVEAGLGSSTVSSWSSILDDLCDPTNRFTTETVSRLTIDLRTLRSLLRRLTSESTTSAPAMNHAGLTSLVSSADALFSAVESTLHVARTRSALENAIGSDPDDFLAKGGKPEKHEPVLLFRAPVVPVTSEQIRAATGWDYWHVVTKADRPHQRAEVSATYGVTIPDGGECQTRRKRPLHAGVEEYSEVRWREKGGEWAVLAESTRQPFKPWKIATAASNALVYGTGGMNAGATRVANIPLRPDHAPDAEEITCQSQGRVCPDVWLIHTSACRKNGVRRVEGAGFEQSRPERSTGDVYGQQRPSEFVSRTDPEGRETIVAYHCLATCPAGHEVVAPSGGAPPACSCGLPTAWACCVAAMDHRVGLRKSGSRRAGVRKGMGYGGRALGDGGPALEASEGNVSRYFHQDVPQPEEEPWTYCPKSPPAERHAGGHNGHFCVKPQGVLRRLWRLILPPWEVGLDCFAGCGSGPAAAATEGLYVVGVEMDPKHVEYAHQHIPAVLKMSTSKAKPKGTPKAIAKPASDHAQTSATLGPLFA